MNACTCGVELKKFWVWRDENGALHASRFAPSNGLEREVFAVTARDALLPITGEGRPRHQVIDMSDPSVVSHGRCVEQTAKETVRVDDLAQLVPASGR